MAALNLNDVYAFSDDELFSSKPEDSQNPAAEELFKRCNALLNEILSFQRSLRRANVERSVELRIFVNQVRAEERFIQGLCLEDPESPKSKLGLKATNLPYLEALWKAAKSTTGITGLCKTFTIKTKQLTGEASTPPKLQRSKTNITVDVVAQNGLQWIKLSLLTPRRLLFDLAKAGWEDGDSSSDISSTSSSDDLSEPFRLSPASTPLATSRLPLIHLASSLLLAASQKRIQYLNPTVHFLFPNLPTPTPATPELQSFVTALTDLGIHVQCGATVFTPQSIPDLVESISTPLSRRPIPLSNPLNLDTTILLALISDVSNSIFVPYEPRFHPAILKQLEDEKEAAMLPVYLFPVIGGRDLVCTEAAAKRFWEIVEIVASDTERERAELMMKTGDVKRFGELCTHPLPEKGLRLPVRVFDDDEEEEEEEEVGEEEVMERVSKMLSTVNRGAFMGGWRRRWTTVTSNKTVAKMIEGAVGDEEVGPDVFVVDTARSLVGKAKRIEV